MQGQTTWDATTIRALRDRLGISQEAMAHLLGVSFCTVNRWEGGRPPSPLSRRALTLLAEANGA